MLADNYAAALALGQGAQGVKVTASEQDGTPQQRLCAPGAPAQTEDDPFCFFLRVEVAHHGRERVRARDGAEQVSGRLVDLGIEGFWNFSHYDLSVPYPEVVVENVHLGDSLMSLGYRLRNQD